MIASVIPAHAQVRLGGKWQKEKEGEGYTRGASEREEIMFP